MGYFSDCQPMISNARIFVLKIKCSTVWSILFRFLAHGDSYASLHARYKCGLSSISRFVPEVCDAIWKVLQPRYMPAATEETWKESEAGFRHRWNFPNCIGAIDGKHVVITCPPKTSSIHFNYKGTFSINLMAIADHKYRFTYISVGSPGSNADSTVFKNTKFGQKILDDALHFPCAKGLPGKANVVLPHVFVADEAFPLNKRIMRPYPGPRGKKLPYRKAVYNYRQSRARRMVESTFGILSQRWRIYCRRICLSKRNAKKVVKATCILHNYLQEDKNYAAVMRQLAPNGEVEACCLQPLQNLPGYRSPVDAMEVRDEFMLYFNNEGALPWQEHYIRNKQGNLDD